MSEGSRGIAGAKGDDATQVPSAGIGLVEREQLAARRFGVFQPALRLFGVRARKQLLRIGARRGGRALSLGASDCRVTQWPPVVPKPFSLGVHGTCRETS